MTGSSGQWPCPRSSAPGMSAPTQSGVPGWCSPRHLPAEGALPLGATHQRGAGDGDSSSSSSAQGCGCQTVSLQLPSLPCRQSQSPFLHTPSPFGKPAVTFSQCCLTDHYFGNPREKGTCPWSPVAGAILCSPLPPWHPLLRGQGHPDLFLTTLGCCQHLTPAFYSLSPRFPAGSPADLDKAAPCLG